MQYVGDNDERYPMDQFTMPDGTLMGWARVVQPYLKSEQALQCASDSQKGGANAALPPAWNGDSWEASQRIAPKQRHLEGANYTFADGHVKWLNADKISGGQTSSFTAGTRAVSATSLGGYQATFSVD